MLRYKLMRFILNKQWKLSINMTNVTSPKSQCKHLKRFSSLSTVNQQLVCTNYGNPVDVVHLERVPVPEITSEDEVLVRFEASTINPADINTIQGVYAIKPDFPFVPGNEAVMEVMATGKNVKDLKEGDKVIPSQNAMGTWRSYAVVQEHELIKIPSHIDAVTASTIAVNPCTAYRMLEDYVSLKRGDVVIQNCANSAVGQAVIQIAASKGVQTINIVRERPNLEELETFLKNLGATLVLTDKQLRSSSELSKLPKPILGLNGVSGKPATELLRKLNNGAPMITYGGMSKQPVIIPVGSLIFNDLNFRGFWMTRWNNQHGKDEHRMQMLKNLFTLVDEGKLPAPPHTLVPLSDYKQALVNAMPADGKLGKKQILSFN